MKYISLFSGIGGFEVAIQKKWKDAECLFYSEIKPNAIKVYQKHYPKHKNLGDIKKITNNELKKYKNVDLLVGGFPCTNLSSMANMQGDNSGLQGKKSGLFYEMLRVIKIVKPKNIIIENNFSMKKENRNIITEELQKLFLDPIVMTMIDSADFGVQSRKRLYWTNFPILDIQKKCTQTWKNVLEPIKKVRKYFLSQKMVECINRKIICDKNSTIIAEPYKNGYKFKTIETKGEKSRWQITPKSDNGNEKSRTFVGSGGGGNNIFIDRRHPSKDTFYIRRFCPVEVERLFQYNDGYVTCVKLSNTSINNLLGNSVVVSVIDYILESVCL